MYCRRHSLTRRQWLSGTGLAAAGAIFGGRRGQLAVAQVADTTAAARDLLRNTISVDTHTHGGPRGVLSKAPPNDDLANGMRAGELAVACLSAVSDDPVLGRNAAGVLGALRAPEPGLLYKQHLERLVWVDELVSKHGLRRALNVADLEAAHKAGQPAIVNDLEGLDFLEGKLERLQEAHQRGIRHVQLVHYTPNDIGDFQTGSSAHQGLTSFGAEVVRACHQIGLVCDLAHATADTAKQAAKIATLSGSKAMGPTPLAARQITADHARAIADTGGSIGLWHFFPTLENYVEGLKEMAEVVGVDHVSIGTDQQDARGCLGNYAQWVQLVAAMLRGGFTTEEAGKIAGGNYLRIFHASVG